MKVYKMDPARLRQMRKAAGLTQTQLAEAVGLTQSAVRYYESSEREPSYPVVFMIANALGTSADYLCGYTDNLSPDAAIIRSEDGNNIPALIAAYRKASEKDRKIIDMMLGLQQ